MTPKELHSLLSIGLETPELTQEMVEKNPGLPSVLEFFRSKYGPTMFPEIKEADPESEAKRQEEQI